MPKEIKKKECPVCHKLKSVYSGFYKSVSPLFANDGCVPICISCVKKEVVNEDGTINLKKFKTMMQRLDKPLYWNSLESSYTQYRKEHGFLSEDEVAKQGKEIIGLYFKNINSLRQNKNKSFADLEIDTFISRNTNMSQSEIKRINRKYNDINGASTEQITSFVPSKSESITDIQEVSWTEQDLKNRNYAIEVIGYDPFDGYPEESKKFLFNSLSPYLEDDDNVDDAYKLSQILQIIENNMQIRVCDKKIANLDPVGNAPDIKTLSGIKNQLVQSNDKIAKENEISVKNRSNKDAGKSSLTYLMRDLREKDFDKAEQDYYDQLKSPGTQWAISVSQKAMLEHCMFDENDKKEVYETQIKLIDNLYKEIDEKKEEIRQLLIKIDKMNLKIQSSENSNGIS